MKATRKIGLNRGRPRLWLEKAILSENGFKHGDRVLIESQPGKLKISVNPDGKHKIAGYPDRPILDVIGKLIDTFLDGQEPITVIVKGIKPGIIHVIPE